jgi:LmbE family N-acetylglucosaminyl deacetylase
MSNRRLLLALAHPDDESFGYGGLIARYVAEGVAVYLIVSTNGDVGTIAPEFLEGHDSVASVRLAELECAAEKLGFTQVLRFGYKDSGMMGSETSRDPACSWQAPREELARKVVEVMREVRPQVVITFNKYGGYGHPDHIAIQRATTDAFYLAADTGYITDGLPAYQPQKLYYSSYPQLRLRYNIWRARLKGQNPRRMGRNYDIDMVKILDHIEPPHARVDVSDYLDAWDDASACHLSQMGGSRNQPPMWFRRRFMSRQGFTRIVPAPAHNLVDEDDLFTGVRLEEPLSVS